jgi:hypothetical protein
VSSISLAKQLGLVILLERWEEGKEYDRLGLRDESFQILGIEMPLVRMPVAPARNIALLVEVAARNQLLRQGGYDAARRFVERVDALVGPPEPLGPGRRGRGSGRARRAVAKEGRASPPRKKPSRATAKKTASVAGNATRRTRSKKTEGRA